MKTQRPFYFTQRKGVIVKKYLDKKDEEFFLLKVLPSLKPISEVDYWKRYYPNLHNATRQSTILFEGKLYWMMEGLVVIELNEGKFRLYKIDDANDEETDDLPPTYNLVFSSWDDRMEHRLSSWIACTKAEVASLMKIDKWTSEVYTRLEKSDRASRNEHK